MSLLSTIARGLLSTHTFERIKAVRSRQYQMHLLKREGLLDAAKSYISNNGRVIKYGPFAGSIYPLESALSRHSIPKLLGTYEQELHHVIREIGLRKYDLVIDIGSAEGYYAVGLARMLRTKVLAYDPEPRERAYCEAFARSNGVSHLIEMKDLFQKEDIQAYRDRRALCICDCEGFESQLFDAESIADLSNWDLLIELHGEAERTLPCLTWQHKTIVIPSAPRDGQFGELANYADPSRLLSEWRSTGFSWLWCDGER